MEKINISKKEDNSSLFLLKLLFSNKIQPICKFCSSAKNKNQISYSLLSKKYLSQNNKNYINNLHKKEIINILKRKTKSYIKYKEILKYNNPHSNLVEVYYNSNSKDRNMKDLCKIYQFAVLKPKIKHPHFKYKLRKCVVTLKIKREAAFRELLQEFSFSRISNINLQVLDKFMKTKKKTIIISKKKNSGVLPSLSSISYDLNFPPFRSSISRVTCKQKQKFSSKSSLIKKDFSINQSSLIKQDFSINKIDVALDLSDIHRNSNILEKKKKLIYNLKLRKKTCSMNKIENGNHFSSGNIDILASKLSEIKLKIPNEKYEDDKLPIKNNLSGRKFYNFKNSNLRPTSKLIKKDRKYFTHRNLTLDLKINISPKNVKKNLKKFIKLDNNKKIKIMKDKKLKISNNNKIKNTKNKKIKIIKDKKIIKPKIIKLFNDNKIININDKVIKTRVSKIKPKKKKTFTSKKFESIKITKKTQIPKLATPKNLKIIFSTRKKSLQEVLYPSLTLKKRKSKLKNIKKNIIKIPEKINSKKNKKKEEDFHNFLYK